MQDEWESVGRWKAPEIQTKTDIYEWPLKPGMDEDDLELARRNSVAVLRQQIREVAPRDGQGLGARTRRSDRRVTSIPLAYYQEK